MPKQNIAVSRKKTGMAHNDQRPFSEQTITTLSTHVHDRKRERANTGGQILKEPIHSQANSLMPSLPSLPSSPSLGPLLHPLLPSSC